MNIHLVLPIVRKQTFATTVFWITKSGDKGELVPLHIVAKSTNGLTQAVAEGIRYRAGVESIQVLVKPGPVIK